MEYTFFLRFQLRDKAAIYSEVKTMHFFLRKICMKKRLESAFVYLCIYLFIYLFIYLCIYFCLFMHYLCAYWGANWFATLTVKQWK